MNPKSVDKDVEEGREPKTPRKLEGVSDADFNMNQMEEELEKQGVEGAPGSHGLSGVPGLDGKDGKDTEDAQDGHHGIDGDDGEGEAVWQHHWRGEK